MGKPIKEVPEPAVFEGAILRADVESVNGLVYSKEILESIAKDCNERTKSGEDIVCIVGDKPSDFAADRIERLRVAAIIPSMHVHEGALRASCETIDTPAGHQLAGELKKMSEVGCSVRVFPIGDAKVEDGKVVKYKLSHCGITAADGGLINLGDRSKQFNQE